MSKIILLESTLDQEYHDEALNWVKEQKTTIANAASVIGISAGAIAGIMAEESHNYFDFPEKHWATDRYAQYDDELPYIPRSHAYWVKAHDSFESDKKPGIPNQLADPIYIDIGYGNFRIGKAIDLIKQYADSDWGRELGLDQYKDDYPKLVADMIDGSSGLTEKLYGLYLKEAEDWFKANNAYKESGGWDQLPVEFRDALLVSFVNVGQAKMIENMEKNLKQHNGRYEPQPMLGTAGGIDHLRHSAELGKIVGLGDYGKNVSRLDDFSTNSIKNDNKSLAYRYALYFNRYTVLEDQDYSAFSALLEIFDPSTGKGNLTKEHIDALQKMLSAVIKSDENYYHNYGTDIEVKPQHNSDPLVPNNVDSSVDHYLFASNKGNNLQVGFGSDYIFGGTGNDTIYFGYDGSDYAEGGRGNDNYHITGKSSEEGHKSYDIEGADNYYIKDFTGKYEIHDLQGDDIYNHHVKSNNSSKDGEIAVLDEDGNDHHNITDFNGKYTVEDLKGDDRYRFSYTNSTFKDTEIQITDHEGKDILH